MEVVCINNERFVGISFTEIRKFHLYCCVKLDYFTPPPQNCFCSIIKMTLTGVLPVV